jgi:hypothetical protein
MYGRYRYARADVTWWEVEPAFVRGLTPFVISRAGIDHPLLPDPVADLRTNVEGTLNILRLCLKYSAAAALRELHDPLRR